MPRCVALREKLVLREKQKNKIQKSKTELCEVLCDGSEAVR